MLNLPTIHPTVVLLIGTAAALFVCGRIMSAMNQEAEARAQAAQREAAFLQRLLLKSVGLLQDYDRALVQGARTERDQLVQELRRIDRHAQASLDAQGAPEGAL